MTLLIAFIYKSTVYTKLFNQLKLSANISIEEALFKIITIILSVLDQEVLQIINVFVDKSYLLTYALLSSYCTCITMLRK